MSSDSIVEQLTKYGEIDEQEAWNGFKQAYLLKTPESRIIDLKACELFSRPVQSSNERGGQCFDPQA